MEKLRTHIVLLSIVLSLLGGCTALPDGVQPVSDFKIEKYLGTWHEIARLDHSFERGLSQITAHYSMREDGGVRVLNRGFNAEDNEWNEAEGKAYFVGDSDQGHLKVSFFGPFYGAYVVIDLDDNYQYSLVSGPDRSYLWILSRQPSLQPEQRNRLVAKAEELGFPVQDLIWLYD